MILDRDEREDLRAEYATGKWTDEELADIWDLTVPQLHNYCATTEQAQSNAQPMERLSEEWWANRTPEVRARRCHAHRRNGAQCQKVAMAGQQVCGTHGGRAPLAKAAARRRIEEAADRMAARLLGMAESDKVPAYVALQAVESALDRAGVSAKTAVDVEVKLKPYEEVMQDLAVGGIAQISRADSRAQRGLPAADPSAPVDVEVVEQQPRGRVGNPAAGYARVPLDVEVVEGPETPPERDGEPMPGPDRGNGRVPDFAVPPERPGKGLMTQEQAVAELRTARVRRVR